MLAVRVVGAVRDRTDKGSQTEQIREHALDKILCFAYSIWCRLRKGRVPFTDVAERNRRRLEAVLTKGKGSAPRSLAEGIVLAEYLCPVDPVTGYE